MKFYFKNFSFILRIFPLRHSKFISAFTNITVEILPIDLGIWGRGYEGRWSVSLKVIANSRIYTLVSRLLWLTLKSLLLTNGLTNPSTEITAFLAFRTPFAFKEPSRKLAVAHSRFRPLWRIQSHHMRPTNQETRNDVDSLVIRP